VTRLTWSDDFTLGHQDLDNEHRLFVDLINVIYSGTSFSWLRPKLNSLLDDIHHLAGQHFRHENAVLAKIKRAPLPSNADRLPFIQAVIEADFDQHLANHAEALRELQTITFSARNELAGLAPCLSSELSNWFIKHVTDYDAHLRPVFKHLGQHRPL
jgi:hemerythrin